MLLLVLLILKNISHILRKVLSWVIKKSIDDRSKLLIRMPGLVATFKLVLK